MVTWQDSGFQEMDPNLGKFRTAGVDFLNSQSAFGSAHFEKYEFAARVWETIVSEPASFPRKLVAC